MWTAYYLGLRAGESLGLRRSDFMEAIGPDGMTIVLRLTRQRQAHAKGQGDDTLKGQHEGNSERYVPVPGELWQIVKDAPRLQNERLNAPIGVRYR